MDFRDMVVDEIRREQMLRHWVDVYEGQEFPKLAIKSGYDEHGAELYVGRCFFHGCVLPANVNPQTKTASFVWGKTYQEPYYQVLVGDCFSWQRVKDLDSYHGKLPEKGVRTGEISSGEPVYVGRCRSGDSLIVGNVLPSRNAIYIPVNGEAALVYDFEILIKNDLELPSTTDKSSQ